MEIQHQENDSKGGFYIEKEGTQIAEITYVFAGPNKIIADHTQVDESLKGQGIGYKLLDKLAEFARDKNLKIVPLCPFVKATFEKSDKYKDIEF